MTTPRNPEIAGCLRDRYDPASLTELRRLLGDKGTLVFPRLRTGLFSAAVTSDYSRGTNYHAAWVRDNVHVAYAHLVNGHADEAVMVGRSLARFLATQRSKFERIVADPARKHDVMQRPHIRFNGDDLTALPQPWAHAQNDALGYFVWLYGTLVRQGCLPPGECDHQLLALVLAYFRAIEYWSDEDSGHWEEREKTSASSIGAVVAGLEQLRTCSQRGLLPDLGVDELISAGRDALRRILPAESPASASSQGRAHDAALLFLIYPLAVVGEDMAHAIATQTNAHLRGSIGIKRYLGDSFYCTDYESLMAQRQDDPTRDFSRDLAVRDSLLRPAQEAEWCLFDPILSIYHGHLYRRTRDPGALAKQTEHLNRALSQITAADPPRCEAFRCPELYYVERGKLQTSKSTPLLWTQANLWTALELMAASLR